MTPIVIPPEHEQLVFDRAYSFKRAAKLIESGGNSIPFVVCYCFAIEVLLKLLLGESGGHTHDVNEIYKKLPTSTRDTVQAFHDEKPRFPAEQLSMRVQRIGNSSDIWRYAYEVTIKGDPIHYVVISDLEEVWEALVRATLKLKPTLKEPAHVVCPGG